MLSITFAPESVPDGPAWLLNNLTGAHFEMTFQDGSKLPNVRLIGASSRRVLVDIFTIHGELQTPLQEFRLDRIEELKYL